MASCNQLQIKALLPLVSLMPTSSCAILDLALSACYLRIYQGLSFAHQLLRMPTSSSCSDIFDQVVYAYYRSTDLRAWLQAPYLSPPHRPLRWAAIRTAPCRHCVRRGGATYCLSAIGKQVTATQAFSILIVFKSEPCYPRDRDDNGRSKQCLGSRQATLAWGAVHSSIVERSHARSRAGLRASTRKDDTQGNDWESTKEKNQTPLSSTSRCVPCCYDESCPPLCPSHAHIIVMLWYIWSGSLRILSYAYYSRIYLRGGGSRT